MSASSTNVVLVVTPQEKSILHELDILGVPYEVCPLDIGDIHIKKNGQTEIIIERKAKKDLLQSIHGSNRYHDQKRRMRETGIPLHNIIYLVEQYHEHPTAWAAITNTLYRDKMSIMMTKHAKQSAVWLRYLKQSMEKHDQGSRDTETSEVCIDKKKKHVQPDEWFMHALTLVRGVSVPIARSIVQQYPTYTDLYEVYKKGGRKALCKTKFNGRCYPTITQRIAEYVFNL